MIRPDRRPKVGKDRAVTSRTTTAITKPESHALAGDGLLHPVVLGAIGLLLVNDQILKTRWPGLVTGKVSDFAGLVFAPILVIAATELLASGAARWRGPSRRAVIVATFVVGLGFAAVKLIPEAERGWELALGVVQWPFAAFAD